MARAKRAPAGSLFMWMATIAYFHGHTEQCPVVQFVLQYVRQTDLINVALVQTLPYAVLLGWDALRFWDVMECSSASTAVEETDAADEDPGEGPPPREPLRDKGNAEEVSPVQADAPFREAQGADPTLGGLKRIVAIEEGQQWDVQRARHFPHIVKEGGIWHHQVLVQRQVCHQLLVPQAY